MPDDLTALAAEAIAEASTFEYQRERAERLQAELSALRAQRDDLQARNTELVEARRAVEADRDAALARVEGLETALAPLAAVAQMAGDEPDRVAFIHWAGCWPLTWGDARLAARLLGTGREGGDEMSAYAKEWVWAVEFARWTSPDKAVLSVNVLAGSAQTAAEYGAEAAIEQWRDDTKGLLVLRVSRTLPVHHLGPHR